jgi:DNA-directed RNA polymerase specialized sigma54-like protein
MKLNYIKKDQIVEKWYITPNVVLREEADEWGILFDADTGASVALNPIAVSMFKAMQHSQDIAVVEKKVREEYEDIPETLTEDIEEFINSLVQGGFVGFEV